MRRLPISLFWAAILLQGCSMKLDTAFLGPEETKAAADSVPERAQRPVNGIWYQPSPSQKMKASEPQWRVIPGADNGYQARYIHKTLNGYAEQLAMGLVQNLAAMKGQGRVAVGSFVILDSQLADTTVLGNLLAEKLIAQLQDFGLAVVDIKTMPQILVGSDGDRVFSREVSELSRKQQLDYVVSGTLTRSSRGVEVNSRMVSLKDQQVVASASGFIPRVVAESLVPLMVQVFP